MSEWNALLTELSKVTSQKQFNTVFDKVQKLYPQAAPVDRVKAWLALENREEQLKYLANTAIIAAQRTADAANANNRTLALQSLGQGIVADAILDGRVDNFELAQAQDSLADAANQLGFDLAELGKKLETPPEVFLRVAEELSQQGKWAAAMRLKMRAVELNPELKSDTDFNAHTAPVPAMTTSEKFKAAKRESQIIQATQSASNIDTMHQIGGGIGIVVLAIAGFSLLGFLQSFAQTSKTLASTPITTSIPYILFLLFLGTAFLIVGGSMLWKREFSAVIPIRFGLLIRFKLNIEWKGAPAIVFGVVSVVTGIMLIASGTLSRNALPKFVSFLSPITEKQFFQWFILSLIMPVLAYFMSTILSFVLPKYRD